MNKIKNLSKRLGTKAKNFLTSTKGLCTLSVAAPIVGMAAGIGVSAITHGSINSVEFLASAAQNVIPCGLGALLASFMGSAMLSNQDEPRYATHY